MPIPIFGYQLARRLPTAAWLLVTATPALANEMQLNMTPGVTRVSQQVYQLHMTIFFICCAIGLLVFGLMFWAIIRHRKSRGVKAAQFHESTKLELLWTAIPFAILIAMAIPATRVLLQMEDTRDAALSVLVTGSQWKWHYQYLDHDIAYYSILATPRAQIENRHVKDANYLLEVDRPLVIPTGVKVRFLMTSQDVIHSWWVPEFAVKKDANPGFINEAWTQVERPGIYRGQCAELCGKDHGFMPIVVIAKTPSEFQQWLQDTEQAQLRAAEAAQQALANRMTLDEAMQRGEQVYTAYCAACHQPNGAGLAGVFPALKGSAVATGAIGAHIHIVLNGKAGTAMQAYRSQLSAADVAAVVTYERNAWGNQTGDLIQAADVQAVLEKQI